MAIKAGLQGDSIDLGILAELFPLPGDPAVGVNDAGYYLTSSSLPDELMQDGGAMRDAAVGLLRRVNGAARLRNRSFRPVELTNTFTDDGGRRHVVALAGVAEVRAYASATVVVLRNGEPLPPPPPAAPSDVHLATEHPDVKDAVELLGKAQPLDWYDLYKLYEIVGDNLFNQQPASGRRRRQDVLTATGWMSAEDLHSFTGSANHQGASGDAARHARAPHSPPVKIMSLDRARQVILDLVCSWIDSLDR